MNPFIRAIVETLNRTDVSTEGPSTKTEPIKGKLKYGQYDSLWKYGQLKYGQY